MRHKICLITGANTGLGKETALALAKQGAQVVMLCRNLVKAEEAKQEIIQQSGNPHVRVIHCDLNDLDSVKQAAAEFRKHYQQLHILINNAGFMTLEKQVSTNGFEATFAVNYLAHVLLTQLLLDCLKSTTPARIINVSSATHKMAKLDMNDLMLEKIPYKGLLAYGNSKLANILFTYTLAKKLQGTGITVNALDPGMVDTEFGSKVKFPLGVRMFTVFLRPWVKTPAEGARTSIHLAINPSLDNISGTYWKKEKQDASSPASYDENLQEKLWEQTQALLKPWL